MIDRQLLRVPFYDATPETQLAEAFSYVYASRYADVTIPGRMQESFLRAWDHDQWDFVPRATAGRPAYVKVRWTGDYRPHLMVAISGFGNWPSLLPIRGTYLTGPYTPGIGSPMQGQVFGLFSSYADTLFGELVADTTFNGLMSSPTPYPIVICGLSMGAAVAEVLTARLRRTLPNLPVRLIKFGSPNIATAEWQDNTEIRLGKTSVYVANDPIQMFPPAGPRIPVIGQPAVYSVLWGDPNKRILQQNGDEGGNTRLGTLDFMRAAMAIPTGDPDPHNVWWNHMWETYRYALTRKFRDVDPLLFRRFAFLEFPNDNSWGYTLTNFTDWRSMVAFQTSPFPDVDLGAYAGESARIEQIRPREATLTVQGGAGGGGDYSDPFWDEVERNGGAGGGGGDPDPAGLGGGADFADSGPDQQGNWAPPVNPLLMQQLPPIIQVQRRRRDRRTINPTP